jgi:UDP:flavonoid glycosyltransferase YjiC (YdhE family)
LINDFPIFYDTTHFGKNVLFIGPLYSEIADKHIEDSQINKILEPKNERIKIFCMLGSSGKKEKLLEIIKMFNADVSKEWSDIILCPSAICPIEGARSLSTNKNVYITDAFVPAKEISRKSDLVICHGGQGTLQTVIMSGVPLAGYPSQPEQKINLQHLQDFGAGIMLSPFNWTAKNIRKKAELVIKNHSYKDKAQELKNYAKNLDSKGKIGSFVWDIIESLWEKD